MQHCGKVRIFQRWLAGTRMMTTCKNVGGLLPWMPVNKNMQEWIDKLESLERE